MASSFYRSGWQSKVRTFLKEDLQLIEQTKGILLNGKEED